MTDRAIMAHFAIHSVKDFANALIDAARAEDTNKNNKIDSNEIDDYQSQAWINLKAPAGGAVQLYTSWLNSLAKQPSQVYKSGIGFSDIQRSADQVQSMTEEMLRASVVRVDSKI